MPLFIYQCHYRHYRVEKYLHHHSDRDDYHELCPVCHNDIELSLSVGRGLTYFEEARGRWLENIGPKPEYVTSHGQWRKLLKKHGREWVGAYYGEKNCWV